MALFDWFKNLFTNGKNNSQSTDTDTLQQEETQTMNSSNESNYRAYPNASTNPAQNSVERQVPRDIFISEDSASIGGLRKVYAFVEKDFEQQGYDDAFSIPDLSHLKENTEQLKRQLKQVIEKEILVYNSTLLDIQTHIDIRSNAGLIDLVYELKTKYEIVKGFKENLEKILENIDQPDNLFSTVAYSYKKGFMRGLVDITKIKILNKQVE